MVQTMIYRVLDVDEWSILAHEFSQRNCPMPDPRFAMIIGAFSESEIGQSLAGFLVCQLQFHAEPLVLYDRSALRGLVHTMEAELLRRTGNVTYFAFGENKVAEICEALGLEKVNMNIYKKTVS